MNPEQSKLFEIIGQLKTGKGLDFSGYKSSMLMRRTQNRMARTNCKTLEDYKKYLFDNQPEWENLANSFLINVSSFFRDPLTFEFINKIILPTLIPDKKKSRDKTLRIWSAGCAMGEESFSISILLNEIFEKEKELRNGFEVDIFATDLDKTVFEKVKTGIYDYHQIENVKIGLMEKYFQKSGNQFQLKNEILESVQFHYYDLLDSKSFVPPESIFGGFDIVLCRNVLIYFEEDFQQIILQKLYRSLKTGGFLILGEAEIPTGKFTNSFARVNSCCKIYKKTNV